MKKLLLAFQFLTIIPVRRMENVSEKEIGRSSAFFPVVGAIQGALMAASSVLLMKVFPSEVVNGIIVLEAAIITAGLHLDGLADTFDAIASRKDKEKKLAIMKESSVGPFGVIAIVFAILLKYLLLNAAFSISLEAYYLSLFLMPLFSRWAMVPAIFHCKSARLDGLGRIFIEHTKLQELVTATSLTLVFLFCAFFIGGRSSEFLVPCYRLLFVLPMLYILSLVSVWFSNKHFGGMTGDTFGAVAELSEILFLMTAVICLRNFT